MILKSRLIKVKTRSTGGRLPYFCLVKKNKNRLTLLLIVSSIGLLLALQAFWLTNSYEKAYFDLRREANDIFRSTMIALRDSALVRNFERVPTDTTYSNRNFTYTHKIDTISNEGVRMLQRGTQVQIFVSSSERSRSDTIQTLLRPLASRIREGKMESGNFVLRLGSDSLSVDSIRYSVAKNFTQSGLNIPFNVRHKSVTPDQIPFGGRTVFRSTLRDELDQEFEDRVYSNNLYTDWFRFDPFHHYSVVLSKIQPLIIRQISPQILFSVFLTLITTAAFVVMYRSIRAQQKLMELKNDFISNITHELKTPVTTVGVALEAIKNFKGQNNPELTSEYLDIAQNELNRLNILTDKILKTAIFDDKGLQINPEPVNLQQIVSQVMNSMKLVFEKQKAQVNFTVEGTAFDLLGGAVHLTSVVYNLLDNALKYSPVEPKISVSLKGSDSEIILKVKDNGIGIAPEYKKKVFEKFFRVPTGDVHNIKGYGLGLSYVDSVVRGHKGTIEVESEPGKGSEFIIRLPKN